ncbi:MAG: BolA family transcriptional regulator, ral stress-responsive regulator [Burkholderiales bacterium]|jgi:BolA protein
MSDRMEQIRSRLLATFAPLDCQLMDESHLHAGHAGAASGGGHYRVQLVSDRFEGLNRVSRHRLVYDCLNDMMHADIHALAIIALAPSEVEK